MEVSQFLNTFFTRFTEKHLVDFVRLFPLKPIIFKQHQLTYQPRNLSRSELLTNLCVLKNERKHGWFKRLTHLTDSFENLPKTYAERYEIRQYASWPNVLPAKAKPECSASSSRDVKPAIGPLLFDAELPVFNVNDEIVFVAKK